ncbi:hypothetical protein [Peredibacter starrii]|uniref:Uncharacterized protein n=1 Tax=Peredibacter starrii TaxID=28202 RepID=A0AAX4HKQ9_9BACT|nr:hypothetical protein [Peredibacter starrii]WPU63847.1 hypothetical protein SOO65_14220 [Peredibacter starrii]
MRITTFLLIALIGYGCAAKKLAVDNADTLLGHQVTKRLPLYTAQKNELGEDIDQFLNKQKPVAQEIVPVIDDMKLESEAKLEEHYKKLEGFYRKIAKDFSALMAKYMAKLDDKQQKDFFDEVESENRQIAKKDKEERVEEVQERLEKFLGTISSDQKQVIAHYGDYFMEQTKKRVERRRELHQKFKSIYAQDIAPTARKDLFQEAFVNYQEEGLTSNKNLEILKKLLPTITKLQREHFRRETQEIKDILSYYLQVNY